MTEEKKKPAHLCQAMLGQPEMCDLSRLLERDEIPMMDGPKLVTWAIVITGREEQLRRPVVMLSPETLEPDDPEGIRLLVFFCPWCGARLRRET